MDVKEVRNAVWHETTGTHTNLTDEADLVCVPTTPLLWIVLFTIRSSPKQYPIVPAQKEKSICVPTLPFVFALI